MKLQPRFYGPYCVHAKAGEVVYALEMSNKGKLHDVFHVFVKIM